MRQLAGTATLVVAVLLASVDSTSAGGTDSRGMPAELVLFLIFVAGVFVVWLIAQAYKSQQAKDEKERLDQIHRDAEAWAARMDSQGLTPISTRLVLKDGEYALLEEDSVLFESRAYRVYGGGGTRIGRVYVGGGVSESQQRLKQIDSGTLTLTTKRLVFDGTHENRTLPMSQLLSVRPSPDAIEVSSERPASRTRRRRPLSAEPLDDRRLKGR
jgi:hypothetical protein